MNFYTAGNFYSGINLIKNPDIRVVAPNPTLIRYCSTVNPGF